ncbi:phosphatase PAP2 family protein [Noviherbaspirillum aridicola]|uniref:Phosphatase PAP2 family protein n=1 Tax=Noviherbaspirillum aridicola TaxID=2849687 RepID=A0ABQ4PYY9_9BURK|nr:phosphatase PAP2 family protein [Noviherbaspirillum aridicola]GIZ50115.1 phosphatase PAP2 family protein [Noviherbaspirillum aridicola]
MTQARSSFRKSLFEKFSALLARVGRAEKSTLLATCVATFSLYGFVELADDMSEGDTRDFDHAVLLAFREPHDLSDPIGPRWFEEVMRDFTALGGHAVLTSIVLAVVGFLLLTRKRKFALMVGLSVAAGMGLSSLLKYVFARPRPDLVAHATEVYTHSFPSGHAMLSAVVYLTLGALLARSRAEPHVKIYLLSVAGLLTVLVGVSRVYLGVHWPSDVLAGWAIGAAWALACWLVMLWLQARGKVGQPTAGVSDPAEG